MNAILALGDLVGVKDVGKFPGCRHSEAIFTAGEPGQGSRPEKALQVDYSIKFAPAQSPNERQQSSKRTGIVPGPAEKLAVKSNDGG